MGKVRSDSVSQENAWLPAGWKPRSPEQGNADAEFVEATAAALSPAQERMDPESQQWLVEELAAPSTQAAKAPVSPTRQHGTAERADPTPTQPPAEREAELNQRVSELERELNHLKDAGQELIEQRARSDELAETLGQRTEELTAAVRERDEALQGRDKALKAEKTARAGSKEAARARKELEKAQAAKKTSDSKLKETEKALIEQRLSKKYEKRETDLEKRFVGRQAALEKQLDEVEERLDIREAELREQWRERERTLNSRIEELEAALTEAQQRAIAKPSRRSPRRKNGKLDINETTFEQLRDLGLSVTLSGRVLSYRDSRGGFETLDELDEVPGLSIELKRVLREQLKAG